MRASASYAKALGAKTERMLERAGPQLRGEIDRDQLGLRVDELVPGHGGLSTASRNGDNIRCSTHAVDDVKFRFHIARLSDLS